MSLETDLEEIEVYLGNVPLQGIKHPNPHRKYKKSFAKILFRKLFKRKNNKQSDPWRI